MANQTFHAATVSVNGKTVGETQTSSFSIKNGGGEQTGLDGVLGISDGITSCTCEMDTICPVAGYEIGFLQFLLKRTYVTIGYAVNGGLLQSTGKFQGLDFSSESKSGEVKGKISFVGDEPKVT